EVVDNAVRDRLFEVPHVERDVEHLRDAPRVVRVGDPAAAVHTTLLRFSLFGQPEMHAGHVVPISNQHRGSDAGINATRHRSQDLHARSLSTPLAISSTATSISWEVESRPSVRRNTPIARA